MSLGKEKNNKKKHNNGKKRIAMISVHSDPLAKLGGREAGGQNVYVAELSKQLGKMGWTVDIFTRLTHKRTRKMRRAAKNVNVIYLKSGPHSPLPKEELLEKLPEFLGNFLDYKEKNKIDYSLVHGHYYDGGWVASQIKRVLNIPMTQTFHSLGHVRHRALEKFVKDEVDMKPFEERIKTEQEIMRVTDKIIATNPPEKKDILRFYSFELEEKIEVIPCGVNLQKFKKLNKYKIREEYKIPKDEIILLYIGRLDHRKGIEVTIRALPKVIKEFSKEGKTVKFIIIGGKIGKRGDKDDIKEKERLEKIAEESGVRDNVIFKGKRDQEKLKQYYSLADIFITAPYYEPFGMTALETMRCGTPIIASNVGGLPHLIKNRKNGLLFPPGKHNSLADRIIKLQKDEEMKKQLSEKGEAMIKEKYGWKTIASEMAKLYQQLI